MKRIAAVAVAVAVTLGSIGVAMATDTATVTVSANIAGNCKFVTNTGTLAFGALDPSNAVLVNGTVSNPQFWCTKGTSYTIGDDNGLNEAGTTFQMKHATLADVIPYTFTYTKTGTGNGPTNTITMNIVGTVAAGTYVNASEGSYADTVTLTLNP